MGIVGSVPESAVSIFFWISLVVFRCFPGVSVVGGGLFWLKSVRSRFHSGWIRVLSKPFHVGYEKFYDGFRRGYRVFPG